MRHGSILADRRAGRDRGPPGAWGHEVRTGLADRPPEFDVRDLMDGAALLRDSNGGVKL